MLGAPPPRRALALLIHPSYCLIRGSPRAAYTWAHHAERASERPDRARPAGVSEPGERGSMPEASPHRATANDRGAERPDPGASAAIGSRDNLVSEPFAGPDVRKRRSEETESKGQRISTQSTTGWPRSRPCPPSHFGIRGRIEPSDLGEASPPAQTLPEVRRAVLPGANRGGAAPSEREARGAAAASPPPGPTRRA